MENPNNETPGINSQINNKITQNTTRNKNYRVLINLLKAKGIFLKRLVI
ncbi:hypothetical protein OOM_1453 [Francisella orientalis str. Toba 04]|nr:hypothetical protein OOM_1453 [Francisella orientalis str. Toba 04]